GQRVALLPEVAGTCPMTFQWFHDGQAVPGATNRFLVLSQVQPTDSGSYQLKIMNSAGQGTSQAVSVTVEPTPFIASGLLPQRVVVGGTMCLEAPVSGSEPMSYQWRLNGTNLVDGGCISGATSRTLCLSAADYGLSGNYSLVASNAYGCLTGLVAQVSVSPIIGWGDNSCDQISTPVGITDVVSVAGGGTHSLALRANGSIVAWGDNAYGQSEVPPGLSNVVALAGGWSHSLALQSDGTVVAWGNNAFGQTNVPSAATNVVSIAAGDVHSMALRADGTGVVWGVPSLTNVPGSVTNVVAIAAGGSGCVALREDGTVVCWGALGAVPASATNVVAIAAGLAHALALRSDGVIIAWGANYSGQTSVPNLAMPVVGIAAGRNHSLALLADGTVVGWGGNDSNQAWVPAPVVNVRALSAGGAHNLALIGPRPVFSTYARMAFLGQSTLFSAGALSGAWAGYQWQFNGVDIPEATNAALVLPSVHWTNAGTYRVVLNSALGVVAGPPMELKVLRTPLAFDSAQCRPDPTTSRFRLRLAGASGLGSVIVYASDDLVTWEPIYTNAPAIGPVDFIDLSSGRGAARFYRAVESSAEEQ
ncbi:MAG TPA: immunoglobulin domain-containing protein, partial [Bacillota bacterium]|nr:immunoglobulin domain-containing protein [Bacillota bacterium]